MGPELVESPLMDPVPRYRFDRMVSEALDALPPELDHVLDNVVVQVKYGPIDFQVREPPSPLFAHLQRTASAIELQVTQEYLGQQCHLVYLPPLWRTILDFDLRVGGERSVIGTDILTGRRFGQKLSGYAAVVNVGLNSTWLGSHLAMSNLYAYGRLAWDPTAGSAAVLEDWLGVNAVSILGGDFAKAKLFQV